MLAELVEASCEVGQMRRNHALQSSQQVRELMGNTVSVGLTATGDASSPQVGAEADAIKPLLTVPDSEVYCALLFSGPVEVIALAANLQMVCSSLSDFAFKASSTLRQSFLARFIELGGLLRLLDLLDATMMTPDIPVSTCGCILDALTALATGVTSSADAPPPASAVALWPSLARGQCTSFADDGIGYLHGVGLAKTLSSCLGSTKVLTSPHVKIVSDACNMATDLINLHNNGKCEVDAPGCIYHYEAGALIPPASAATVVVKDCDATEAAISLVLMRTTQVLALLLGSELCMHVPSGAGACLGSAVPRDVFKSLIDRPSRDPGYLLAVSLLLGNASGVPLLAAAMVALGVASFIIRALQSNRRATPRPALPGAACSAAYAIANIMKQPSAVASAFYQQFKSERGTRVLVASLGAPEYGKTAANRLVGTTLALTANARGLKDFEGGRGGGGEGFTLSMA